MIIQVISGKYNVKLFLLITISPGSFPKPIFPPSKRTTPIIASIMPNTIMCFPKDCSIWLHSFPCLIFILLLILIPFFFYLSAFLFLILLVHSLPVPYSFSLSLPLSLSLSPTLPLSLSLSFHLPLLFYLSIYPHPCFFPYPYPFLFPLPYPFLSLYPYPAYPARILCSRSIFACTGPFPLPTAALS